MGLFWLEFRAVNLSSPALILGDVICCMIDTLERHTTGILQWIIKVAYVTLCPTGNRNIIDGLVTH